ncbi:MAG: hypothetical protein IJF83_02115 [Methanobrevibacter sp.]|nr:hypothetical protein [Methanobrevibacter sp.]
MKRKIIIALIIIVLIVLAGLIVFSTGIKGDTQITFLSNTSLKNGDHVEFELVDAQGNPLANQEVNITFEGNGEKQNFTITTDSQGRGTLVLNEEADGNYTINVSYGGDDKHNGCSASQKITIGDASETSQPSETVSEDSSSDSNSDDEQSGNSGVIQSGQNEGLDSDYINNNKPNIVNGSLE